MLISPSFGSRKRDHAEQDFSMDRSLDLSCYLIHSWTLAKTARAVIQAL